MIAGVVSQAVDTVIFITVAFYGVAPLMKIMPGSAVGKSHIIRRLRTAAGLWYRADGQAT